MTRVRRRAEEDSAVRIMGSGRRRVIQVKKIQPVTVSSYSVIATQEADGKETVWLENPRR